VEVESLLDEPTLPLPLTLTLPLPLPLPLPLTLTLTLTRWRASSTTSRPRAPWRCRRPRPPPRPRRRPRPRPRRRRRPRPRPRPQRSLWRRLLRRRARSWPALPTASRGATRPSEADMRRRPKVAGRGLQDGSHDFLVSTPLPAAHRACMSSGCAASYASSRYAWGPSLSLLLPLGAGSRGVRGACVTRGPASVWHHWDMC